MKLIWFDHQHLVDGYLTLISNGNLVELRCHWPFDLEDDEWIDIENKYDTDDYMRAVEDALTKGKGKVVGIEDGFLEVTSSESGFILEFSGPQQGWSAKSLRLLIRRPLRDLLSQRDDV
jgi:hypothetical protein